MTDEKLLFGTRIKQYRLDLSLSQESFCEGICSLRQYRRIESNDNDPSLYTLNLLSNKYNFDFNSLYKICQWENGDYNLALMNSLNYAIVSNDVSLLEHLLDDIESTNLERSNSEIVKCYYYGKAILNKNNDEGLNYALKGIHLECPSFDNTVESLKKAHVYSNVGHCLINYIALCEKRKGNIEVSKMFFEYLLYEIQTLINSDFSFYQSNTFLSNFYPKIVVNYCNILIDEACFTKALCILDEALALLFKKGNMRYIENLLWCKYKCGFHSKKYQEAEEVYSQLVSFCKMTDNQSFLTKIEEWRNSHIKKDN